MLFVGFVCAAVLAAWSWQVWHGYEMTLRETRRDVGNLARSMAQQAQDTMDEVDAVLTGVIERLRSDGTPSPNMGEFLAGRAASVPHLQALFLYDAAGNWLVNSLSGERFADSVASEGYFRYHRDHADLGPRVGRPFRTMAGRWVFPLSRRIDAAGGVFAGVVVATVPVDDFVAFYKSFDFGEQGALALIRGDGVTIARYPSADSGPGKDLRDAPLFRDALSVRPRGSFRYTSDFDGVVRIGGFDRAEKYPLIVVGAVARAEALADWRRETWAQGAACLALVGVIGLLGRGLARQMGAVHAAQLAVSSSEALHRSLAENVSDLIVRLGADGRRTYVSPSSHALLGYEPSELLDRRCGSFVAPEDDVRVDAAIRAMLAGGPSAETLSFQAVRRDGRRVWIESRHALVRDARTGRPCEIVAVLRDVGQQKLIEERLEQARLAAEAANRTKSEFLANMSHEIRTPMNGIIGMTRLLLGTVLSAEQRRFADAVRVSADALMGLIDDILDISKLEAGKVALECIEFGVEDLVDAAVELMAPRAQGKGLEFAALVDEGARRTLRGDPSRVRQILLNLMSNAIKFTERGFVSIEVTGDPVAGPVAGPGSDPATALRIVVQDSGIGIDAAARRRLFGAFEQADGSVTRRFGGSGLGLAISRQLAELMGGSITVDSTLGLGSRFTLAVTLPDASLAVASRDVRTRAMAGRRVLFVDDFALNRTIMDRRLAPYGAAFAAAADGTEALGMLRAAIASGAPYDLLLLDDAMPDMDGPALARAARALPGAQAMRIVLIGSLGSGGATAAGDPAGWDVTLAKPVGHRDLSDCLGRLFPAGSLSPAAWCPPRAAGERPGARGAGHVLIVEDNAINLMLVETLLRGAGYTTGSAADGAAAIERASQAGYDLILMDIQMPGVDGVQATRAIRAGGGPNAAAPIIALTANAMAGDRGAYLAAGMNDYISKPIDARALLAAVSRWTTAAEPAPAPAPHGEPSASSPLLDASVLDRLAAMVPAAKLDALLRGYLAAAAARVETMAQAARADDLSLDDLALLAREAHDLKANSGNFGVRRLQHLAEQLEQACADGDAAQTRAIAAVIERAAEPTWAALRARLHHVQQQALASVD